MVLSFDDRTLLLDLGSFKICALSFEQDRLKIVDVRSFEKDKELSFYGISFISLNCQNMEDLLSQLLFLAHF